MPSYSDMVSLDLLIKALSQHGPIQSWSSSNSSPYSGSPFSTPSGFPYGGSPWGGAGIGTGGMGGIGLTGQLNENAYIPSQLDFSKDLAKTAMVWNPFQSIYSIYNMQDKINQINNMNQLAQASLANPSTLGVPGFDTAFGSPQGFAIGPLSGGMEAFGPMGPGPAGDLGIGFGGTDGFGGFGFGGGWGLN